MLFKKSYSDLVQQSLMYLTNSTSITNTSIGGISRSIAEVINKNLSDFYDVLDTNMDMVYLSTSQGYFLDLIGTLFNMPRFQATNASVTITDGVQRFYVLTGTLFSLLPDGIIPADTIVSSQDGVISYYVTADTPFSISATEVFVPISANATGSSQNVGVNILTSTDIGIPGVYTTNIAAIVSGTDTESDANYKFRLMNATVSAEKANEVAIRLAVLSVDGVSDLVIKPFANGIGTYNVIVIPSTGIASSSLISSVQTSLNNVQAYGVKGIAIAPTILPVEITAQLTFAPSTTAFNQSSIMQNTVTSINNYITSIPIGGTFVYNELITQIMETSPSIKDVNIVCYYFRQQPMFHGNITAYWDELFYPDPSLDTPITVN